MRTADYLMMWVVLILLWAGVLSQVPPSGGGIFRYPLAEKLHDPARGSKSVIDDNFAPHAVNSSTTNITPETQSWSEGSNYTQLANVSQPEDRQGELAPVLVTAVPNNSLVENRQVEQQASSQPPEEMTTRPATMTTSSTTTVGPVSTTSTLRPMTVRIDHGGLETTTTELATITLNATPAKPEYCAPCDEELKNLTQTIKRLISRTPRMVVLSLQEGLGLCTEYPFETEVSLFVAVALLSCFMIFGGVPLVLSCVGACHRVTRKTFRGAAAAAQEMHPLATP